MCRLCGRVVKCIFESMPSRVQRPLQNKAFGVVHKRTIHSGHDGRPSSSRALIRAALNLDNAPTSHLPPTFLLPLRARLHQVASHQTSTPESQPLPMESMGQSPPVPEASNISLSEPQVLTSTLVPPQEPLVLSKSLQTFLPLLHAQKPHYITAHIHRFPYLVTAGDTLRLPFHMPHVQPGDILRLNRASLLGSRDFTLKAGTTRSDTYDGRKLAGKLSYIDERIFECRARVLGVDSGPMMIKEKTKRRNRKVKTVKSKHKYTVLKIMEVKIKGLDELKQENETMLLSSTA